MKSIKKILAFTLVLAACLSCFASCNLFKKEDPKALMEAADEALKTTPYTSKISTSFSTENQDMKEAIAALSNSAITLAANGNDFEIRMSVVLEKIKIYKSYVGVNNVLYHENMTTVNENTVFTKEKADFSNADLNATLSNIGAGANISHEDFDTLTLKKSKDTYTVTCTDIKNDALASLCNILSSNFTGTGATFMVNSVKYEATIENGKYEKTSLTCNYIITISNTTYIVTMELTNTYNYKNDISIVAPYDIEQYTEVSYTDIVK